MTIGDFATIIATGGLRYKGSCISWGRSEKRNAAVDGHPDSFHMSWLAADVTFDELEGVRRARAFYERLGLHVKANSELTLHVQVVPPRT